MLDRRPAHDDAVALVLTAWGDLSSCRSIGMALGPIPWTAIVAWAAHHGLDREATDVLRTVIRRLDSEYLEQQASKERT